ncbi:hypothetical protein ACIO8G_20255 [Streptomyces sp. NPDC087219]|uniref:hypothetical protein n=1 Tax=Streptomyces sp. NPDC087219 TaxID=3365770 RepID=UPI00382DC6C5
MPSTMYGKDSAIATSPIANAPDSSKAIHMTAIAYSRSPKTDRACPTHSVSTDRLHSSRT